jgi:uncharacterized protein
VKIGVVSDTHGYYDACLAELLSGVNTIIHAGDVGSKDVLEELSLIAPVHAVRGNVDLPDPLLPLTQVLQWEGVQVEVMHVLPVSYSQLEQWSCGFTRSGAELRRRERFLKAFDAATRVIVFGHSHQPCARILDGRLFVNPGSAGKKRFSLPRSCGVMDLSTRRVAVKILTLDYNQNVPEPVELTFGE